MSAKEKQTIFLAGRREDPFARVPKMLLDDDRLSWKAKGIVAYLLGKPANWRVQVTDIVARGNDGEKAVRSAIAELRAHGYSKLEPQREGGRITGWLIKIADHPMFSPDAENRHLVPDAGFLHVEKLQVENGDHSKKELTEKETASKKEPASEAGMKFADFFRDLLPPDLKLSANWKEQWARCYDDMLRLDGRTREQVAKVCRWARSDDFWKANFLTPLKLRQRKAVGHPMYFDVFLEKMKTPARGETAAARNARKEQTQYAAPVGTTPTFDPMAAV